MQLDYNEQRAVNEFHSLIKKEFDVTKLILFGSRARGDADNYSDIDLLVLSKNREKPRDFLRLSKIAAEVSVKFGVAINCLYENDQQWSENKVYNPKLKTNIDKEGINLEL